MAGADSFDIHGGVGGARGGKVRGGWGGGREGREGSVRGQETGQNGCVCVLGRSVT